MPENKKSLEITPNRALVKSTTSIVAAWLLLGMLLFVGAGRLDWGMGWLFFILWGVLKLIFIFLLRYHDPELLVERVTKHKNTQHYERLIIPFYFLLCFGTILLAGLDGGRFRWSGKVPLWLIIVFYIVYLLGNILASWAASANPFFSLESRLQSERGQEVIRMGPYQWVRHPAYLTNVIIWPVTGPLLESWWAILPGLLAALMMFIRTVYEDRMLQAELEGYAAYSQEVRYRLFPGIW